MNVAGWKDIVEAAKQRDFEAVKYFVETKGASITSINENNQTVAHIAVENDQFFMFRYCVAKDPSVIKCRDNKLRNVLVRAVQKNSFSIVVHLLETYKEDILKSHNLFYGLTIVHIAAQQGHLELLKYLLEERYIDCDIKNDVGETPLFFAVENVHMPVVQYLVEEQHANVFATDENKDHVLYVSAWRGDLIVPRYLLDKLKLEVDLNSRDRSGETVLHRAVEFGHLEFTKYLVDEKRVKVNVDDKENKTPLHYAVEQSNFVFVKYLCEHGARVDVPDAHNRTVLELATDKRISEYLKENASIRSSRSVSTIFHQRIMVPDSACTNEITARNFAPIGNGQIPFQNNLSTLKNGILTFASLCLKYSIISGYLKPKISSLPLTSVEILKSRMDPIAIEVIETVSGFENS